MPHLRLLALACLATLVACDDGDSDPTTPDTGPATDAAPTPDASLEDAAVLDAQPQADANLGRDPVMFLTDDKWDVGGGFAGADEFCMTDSANPGSGTFKALLGGSDRSVCVDADCASGATPVDWVLQPNTTYTRLDDAVVFTTNADGIFTDWPMLEEFAPGTNQASGLDTDWTVRDGLHCENWTVASDDPAGVGWTASLDGGFLQGGQLTCRRLPLVCVEQR